MSVEFYGNILYTPRRFPMSSERPLILVVDDDGPILLLMRSILREFGFEPVAVNNGPAAIAAAREHRPSVVLLDRNMPNMSGDEVVHALRTDLGMTETPILILSGEPIEPDELATIGATGSVLKPFDVNELISQIRGAMAGA
ncbi:MAG: response regulator [Acidobacteria bacterium]|nr:response regulator [Acidobacteriota bacterium]